MSRVWFAVLASCLWWLVATAQAVDPAPMDEPQWQHVQHIEDPSGAIVAVALIRNPDRVVVADSQGRISFWWSDLPAAPWDSNPPVYAPGSIRALATDVIGKNLAVAAEHSVTVWEPVSGDAVAQFRIHDGQPATVDVDALGNLLAARTGPHAVTVWTIALRAQALALRGVVRDVTGVALGGGRSVAVGGARGEAEVWRVWRQERLFRAPVQRSVIRCVALTAGPEHLVTGAADGEVRVWHIATEELVGAFNTGQGAVTSVRICAGGRRVVTACESGAVQLWDIATGTEVRRDAPVGSGARAIVMSHDRSRFAAVGHGYGAWKTASGKALPAPGRGRFVTGVQLSHDGSRVVAEYAVGDAQVFEVVTGKAVYANTRKRSQWEGTLTIAGTPTPPTLHASRVRLLTDGHAVLLAGEVTAIFVGQPQSVLAPSRVGFEAYEPVPFPDSPRFAWPCVLSPDHSLLVTGSQDGRLHLWDVAERRHLRSFRGRHDPHDRFREASLDRANRVLAGLSGRGDIELWDVATGERRELPALWAAGGRALRVSPDGRYLLLWVGRPSSVFGGRPSAEEAGFMRLWDLTAAEEAAAPKCGRVIGATWGADPTLLYLLTEAPGGMSVEAWSPGEDIARTVIALPGPSAARRPYVEPRYARPDGPRRLAMSYDGSTMAMATNDGSIDVWRQAGSSKPAPRHREP